MLEIGHIAGECPLCQLYHVSAEGVLLEILREDGSPTSPGQVGRVVVTSFYNYAMPFIRYETGDFAVAAERGTCKRTLPTISRIVGRVTNMFVMPDGTKVWPYARDVELRRFLGFSQMQMVQTSVDRIEVRYVPDGSQRQPDLEGLQTYLREIFHSSVQATAVAVDRLGRLPSGKFEEYVSLVTAGRV
jgi:phenylacetate-CoA ligase